MGPATTNKAQSYEFDLQAKYECTVCVVHTNRKKWDSTKKINKISFASKHFSKMIDFYFFDSD